MRNNGGFSSIELIKFILFFVFPPGLAYFLRNEKKEVFWGTLVGAITLFILWSGVMYSAGMTLSHLIMVNAVTTLAISASAVWGVGLRSDGKRTTMESYVANGLTAMTVLCLSIELYGSSLIWWFVLPLYLLLSTILIFRGAIGLNTQGIDCRSNRVLLKTRTIWLYIGCLAFYLMIFVTPLVV